MPGHLQGRHATEHRQLIQGRLIARGQHRQRRTGFFQQAIEARQVQRRRRAGLLQTASDVDTALQHLHRMKLHLAAERIDTGLAIGPGGLRGHGHPPFVFQRPRRIRIGTGGGQAITHLAPEVEGVAQGESRGVAPLGLGLLIAGLGQGLVVSAAAVADAVGQKSRGLAFAIYLLQVRQ